MSKIERAYLILGLESGASLKQVDEAFRDMCTLWDPGRLSSSPRLRAKSTEKMKEISAAYSTLMEHLSQTDRGPSGSPKAVQRPVDQESVAREQRASTEDSASRPAASLFDDAFSDRIVEGRRRIPLWGGGFVVLLSALLVGYLVWTSMNTTPDLSRQPSRVQETSELSRVVEEVRNRSVEPPADEKMEVAEPEAESTDRHEVEAPKPPPRREPTEKTSASPSGNVPGGNQASARLTQQKGREPLQAQPPESAPSGPLTPKAEAEGSSPTKPRPKLVRDSVLSQQDDQAETTSPYSAAEQAAFESLLENSPVAKSLVGGDIDTLNFAEWSVVQKTPSAVWIDLVAHWASGGQEVHLIWAIDTATGAVRPLSQAARTLESDPGS